MKTFLFALAVCAICIGSISAAPIFPQCPAVGVNTGCQFLITIGPGGGTTVAMDSNAPNNGPYDGSDDTLIGVLNNSSVTVNLLPLSSAVNLNGGLFAFEGDGPCSQSVKPASCPSSSGFPGDPTGYGGPGVTFSNIAANNMSGTVNFAGGLAPGKTAWFGVEDVFTSASQITGGNGPGPGPGPGTVPEPASVLFMSSGLAGLGLLALRRKRS